MEFVQVLPMNGGMGNTSYANNSLLQQKVISMTKPIIEEAISNVYCSMSTRSLAIADLGCSSGPNTFFLVSELIEAVDNLCRKLGHQSPEYQVFLNDLPGNDFNTIFESLPSLLKKLSHDQLGPAGSAPCFLSGVPGSFYGRLFPSNSLHFVHSSYSLHWLSQVPKRLESNKGNIYIASTSPPSVLRAYYEQFQRDFSIFLKCRAVELVTGGRMVLTFLGRRSKDPSSKECCYIFELLAIALNDMVSEGLIEEEKMDSFNIPNYTPSPSEVESEAVKEGSFSVVRLEVSEVDWNAYDDDSGVSSSNAFSDGGYNVTKCMRAVAEPLLVAHFGDAIIDEVFRRYRKILSDRLSKEKNRFTNVTISLTKTG
uniref:Salicylic acid methyl transferase n=1 Tax=Betula lenta TaxID=216994 RepID=A0A7H1RGP8_BETLE|nr:salicylic acid methyl transferase [Betula lenta]